MDAKAEQRSLNECPLPPVIIKNPLTRIHEIDGALVSFEARIKELREEREELLQYSIQNHIIEDTLCQLVTKVTPPQQKVDVERLRTERPDVLDVIRNTQRFNLVARIREQFHTLGTSITHDELKRVVPNPVFESFLYRPGNPKISYEVVRK